MTGFFSSERILGLCCDNVVTIRNKTVAYARQHDSSIFNIYKHPLEQYKNYPNTLPSYKTHREEETCSKLIKTISKHTKSVL